jgi:nicotinamidase-related amidase
MSKETTNNVLVVVDCQKDFISGSLPVKGAAKAVKNILSLIKSGVINEVIFTADYHPVNHSSFKENGGEWPRHCVEYTEGAGINDELINAVVENQIPYVVIPKGTDPKVENYSAFKLINVFDEDVFEYGLAPHYDNAEKPGLSLCTDPDAMNDNVIVCGLAGDVCVLNTLKALKAVNPAVYVAGTASLDDGKTLKEYIAKGCRTF